MVVSAVIVAAMLGGFAAGVLALAVGGLGVLLQLRRQLSITADAVGDLEGRLEREVKRRAADASLAVKAGGTASSRQLGPLRELDEQITRAEILRRHGG